MSWLFIHISNVKCSKQTAVSNFYGTLIVQNYLKNIVQRVKLPVKPFALIDICCPKERKSLCHFISKYPRENILKLIRYIDIANIMY